MSDNIKTAKAPISDEQVAHYLRQNPQYFDRHPELLLELRLSHPSGQAVSLIERQVTVLRQRNTEMRQRLNDLLENARENDRLLERTKRLVLALLECNELGDVVDALYYSFDKEFGIPFVRLILFNQTLSPCNARLIHIDQARVPLNRHLKSTRTASGGLNQDEIQFLFDEDASDVGSAALAVLSYGNPLGVLAVGNPNTTYYQSSMGTLFLNHIAEVLNRILPQYLSPP